MGREGVFLLPSPKAGPLPPSSTARQAQLQLGGSSSSGLNLCFATSCECVDGPAGTSAVQNTSWAFPLGQERPTKRGIPCPLFPCPSRQIWGNTTRLSRLELKPLGAVVEKGTEKKEQKTKAVRKGRLRGSWRCSRNGLWGTKWSHILDGFGTTGSPRCVCGRGGDSSGVTQQLGFPASSASRANSLRALLLKEVSQPCKNSQAWFSS